MKKKIFITALIASALLNNVKAQTWNLGGNAPTATSVLGNTTNQNLNIITNNATRMTIKKSGQVGIGTSNPTSTLQVQKSTLSDVLVKSTGNGAQITVDRAGNGWDAVTRYMQTGVPQWKTGLMVNATGSPDYVIKNEMTNTDALTIVGNGSNYVNINSGNFTLNSTSYLYNTTNDLNIHAYAPSNFQPFTPGNILLAYPGSTYKSGNVGIGTSDPSRAKFVVAGNVGKTNAIFGQGSTGISLVQNSPSIGFNSYYGSTAWKSLAAGYGAKIFMDPSNGVIYFGGTTASATGADQSFTETVPMAITPDGRVIINSTNYTSTLAVKKVSTAADAASFQGTTLYSHFAFGNNEDTYIRGGLAASNIIIADLCNNVGIGTPNPAYKLDVCGTMRAKEVRVATGWCDYVFADDYKLPALSDVENFIKVNRHLPDVTPGAIIESEGLEIGKTSAQMIKKIEELTLYVIDLQKQVNELRNEKK